MRKTTLQLLMTFIAVISFSLSSNAAICTQTFTASGQDDDPTTVNIIPSDITCTGGGTINTITLVNTAGNFTNGFCGDWYDFTLVIDGVTIIANGCQVDFDGTVINPTFSTIQVYSNDLDGWSDAVDITFDLEIDYTPPTCPAPTALTATNITVNSADLAWTENGTATTWNIELGPQGFTPTGTPTDAGVTTNPYNVTGLTVASSYDFYVQAYCGVGDLSVWVGPFTFNTACGTVVPVTTIPWTEDFESFIDCNYSLVDNNALGNLWYLEDVNNLPTGDFSNNGNTTGLCLLANSSDATTDVDVSLITPPIYLTQTGLVSLEFSFESNFQDFAGDGDAYCYVSNDSMQTWTQIFTETNDEPTNGTIHSFDFTSYINDTIFIKFDYVSPLGAWDWAIDNLSIINITCPNPTALNVTNLTATAADLTWTTGGSTEWDILFGYAGFDTTGMAPSVENTTNNPYTIDTLMGATSYEFYVRDDCGANDTSGWVGPFTFTTLCAANNTLPFVEDFEAGFNTFNNASLNSTNYTIETTIVKEGTQSAHIAYQANDNDSLIVVCPIELLGNANPKMSFWHIAKTEGGWDEALVKISVDGGAFVTIPDTVYEGMATYTGLFDEDSYTEWGTGTETPDNTWWKKETFNLSAYNTSSDVRILFELVSDGSGQRAGWYIDSIAFYNYITDLALVFPGNMNYSDCIFTGQDTITFFVENVGSTVIPANDTIFAWYELDGAAAVADTFIIATDLNPTDTLIAEFAQTGNLAGLTTHNYKVYFEYEPGTDMNQVNDTTIGTVTHYMLTVDLGGVNDTIQTAVYPYILDAGTGFDSYLWNDGTTNQTLSVSADGWYTVIVTDTNACDATDSVYVVLTTNIINIDGVSLDIYPNPNNGEFTLSANFNTNVDFTVEMVNLNGKTIYTKEFNGVDSINETIDVDGYAKGIYYIRIVNEKFVKQEKVVIY